MNEKAKTPNFQTLEAITAVRARVFPFVVCRINPHRTFRADFHARPETGTLQAPHVVSQ